MIFWRALGLLIGPRRIVMPHVGAQLLSTRQLYPPLQDMLVLCPNLFHHLNWSPSRDSTQVYSEFVFSLFSSVLSHIQIDNKKLELSSSAQMHAAAAGAI